MSSFREIEGVELGPTSWIDVTQERIDAFADATDDHQWIHVDPERAAGGPFGTTIAHGYLTLSLCVPMLGQVLPPSDGMVINYGVDRVRFPAPVPSGRRIRGRFRVASVEDAGDGREGRDRGDGGVRGSREARLRCAARPPHSALTDMSATVAPRMSRRVRFALSRSSSSPPAWSSRSAAAIRFTDESCSNETGCRPPTGLVGVSYLHTVQIAPGGGTAPYQLLVITGSLPPGLSLNSGNGQITGKPTAGGDVHVLHRRRRRVP